MSNMTRECGISKESVVNALALPQDARVDQRVPKKLLTEQGAITAADKKYIQEGIEELVWVAALKPTNVGIAIYRDEVREYLEIAVLDLVLRPTAKAQRLSELIHRAIPYPVVLIMTQGETLFLSLAHQRFSQNESGKSVVDGKITTTVLCPDTEFEKTFLGSIALAAQPSQNLFALYQGWVERVEALLAARITGQFSKEITPENAADRREALSDRAQLERELVSLRGQATKEKHINQRVELNLAIKKLEARLKELTAKL